MNAAETHAVVPGDLPQRVLTLGKLTSNGSYPPRRKHRRLLGPALKLPLHCLSPAGKAWPLTWTNPRQTPRSGTHRRSGVVLVVRLKPEIAAVGQVVPGDVVQIEDFPGLLGNRGRAARRRWAPLRFRCRSQGPAARGGIALAGFGTRLTDGTSLHDEIPFAQRKMTREAQGFQLRRRCRL